MRSDARRRRESIIDAACVLLAKQGQRIKLEEVAENAGVGIATLYRNFPTRNALIHDCVLRMCDSMEDHVDRAIAEMQVPGADIEQVLRDLIPMTIPMGVNVLVPTLVTPPEDMLPEKLRLARQRFVGKVYGMLDGARHKGLIHYTVSNKDVLMGLVRIYQPPVLQLYTEEEDTRNVDAIVDIFLKGCELGPDKRPTHRHF